jgi:hypothetical protein
VPKLHYEHAGRVTRFSCGVRSRRVGGSWVYVPKANLGYANLKVCECRRVLQYGERCRTDIPGQFHMRSAGPNEDRQ